MYRPLSVAVSFLVSILSLSCHTSIYTQRISPVSLSSLLPSAVPLSSFSFPVGISLSLSLSLSFTLFLSVWIEAAAAARARVAAVESFRSAASAVNGEAVVGVGGGGRGCLR